MTPVYVLDTNIALYLIGGRLIHPLPIGRFYLSVISEMELLSYHSLSELESLRINRFLSEVTIINLDHSVKNSAILLRKKYRLKLPDAIVCATALSVNGILLSNDVQLRRVLEIKIETVEI